MSTSQPRLNTAKRRIVLVSFVAAVMLLCGVVANIIAVAQADTTATFLVAFTMVLIFLACITAVCVRTWRIIGQATGHLPQRH